MKKLIVLLICFALLPIVINEGKESFIAEIAKVEREDAQPVIVSKDNPFYALIATPVALYYENNVQHIQPLLIENISNPSKPIQRFKELYDMDNAIVISGGDVANISNEIALKIWKKSNEAIIVKNDFEGYKIAISLIPLACYKGIPVFVANDLQQILATLKILGVKTTYVCGNIKGYGNVIRFYSNEEAMQFLMHFIKEKFGSIDYIVMTNPLDITKPEVLESVEYEFKGTINSGSTLHGLNILLSGFNYTGIHKFYVPYDGYARIKIELINLDSEDVDKWGDRLFLHIISPSNITFVYTSTAAGLPVVKNGSIVVDKLNFQTCVYDMPGEYKAEVVGTWIAKRKGSYEMKVKVEKIDRSNFPLMENLSSLAPYLASYHKGIVFANTSFAFAGNESIGIGGVVYPVKNEFLVEKCNEHVLKIHNKLNELLAEIADLPNDVYELWNHYKENPIYIAIVGDTTMIPMFYYYNPDSDYLSGQGVASDFIYGDIDINLEDMENDTFTYYPFQENAVGRLTSWDAEDLSALIARTIFYDDIINKFGEWKKNATVQTVTGIEFQYIPIISPLANKLKSIIGFGPVRQEPTKFPTGESKFINKRLCNNFEKHGFNVFSAYRLEAQREGLIMERKGGEYQLNSNYIFAFNHGTYYLFEAGDMLEFDQLGLGLKTGLSGKGSFDVRHVINMPFKPSVAFIESCLVGKIEGLLPENCLSQAYLHAGVNAFIAASRYTADPGYLEPGLIFKGFGIYGYLNATKNLWLYGKYPDLHFGALLAEDFFLDLLQNDSTVGMALRNAKNKYLPKDANSTFMWTPPLYYSGDFKETITWNWGLEETRALDKKYVCLHEFNLYGDPAFNPWD